MSEEQTLGYLIGSTMACHDSGLTAKMASLQAEVEDVPAVLGLAARMFDKLGDYSKQANMYRAAAHKSAEGETGEAFKVAASDFLSSLDDLHTIKEAFSPVDLAKTMAGTVPDVWQTALGAGVLGGSSLGALYWWLNRHSRESDLDIEEAIARRDHYRQVAHETKRRIQSRVGRAVDSEEIDPKELAYTSAHDALNALAPNS